MNRSDLSIFTPENIFTVSQKTALRFCQQTEQPIDPDRRTANLYQANRFLEMANKALLVIFNDSEPQRQNY